MGFAPPIPPMTAYTFGTMSVGGTAKPEHFGQLLTASRTHTEPLPAEIVAEIHALQDEWMAPF